MKRELRDVGASVRARLLDQARREQSDFQLLLTRYVLERLLYRLSVSEYHDRFVLKGALLLSVWVGNRYRPTRDLDLLGYGDTKPEALINIFRTICGKPVVADGVTFDVDRLEAELIREDAEYGGIRIRTTASIAGARIPVQVDIGSGDAITPAPVEIEYPTLLEFPAPHLRAYPVETIVAEKLEAVPDDIPAGLTGEFAAAWQTRWRAFVRRERMMPVPDDLGAVTTRLRDFVVPVIRGGDQDLEWPPGGAWSQR